MITLGIDPGKTGALAVVGARGLMHVEDMPIAGNDVDPAILADVLEQILQGRAPGRVILERQQAMPRQGVSSCFVLGKRYGMLLGICACLDWPVEIVSPAKWKRLTSTPRDKDAARARASQLMPEGASWWRLKKHDGRAEAALLAWYGANVLPDQNRRAAA